MTVPLLPVGGTMHGKIGDFSTVIPEKHLWVSEWAHVCLRVSVWFIFKIRPHSNIFCLMQHILRID